MIQLSLSLNNNRYYFMHAYCVLGIVLNSLHLFSNLITINLINRYHNKLHLIEPEMGLQNQWLIWTPLPVVQACLLTTMVYYYQQTRGTKCQELTKGKHFQYVHFLFQLEVSCYIWHTCVCLKTFLKLFDSGIYEIRLFYIKIPHRL